MTYPNHLFMGIWAITVILSLNKFIFRDWNLKIFNRLIFFTLEHVLQYMLNLLNLCRDCGLQKFSLIAE